MADKRRKCTISDDGMHVTPCEMLESQAEFGHPRGKKRGIFCWQYTSSETGLKTRTFFGVVSTESPNGMIFNCCPFCGERIDHPCLEPDERAELLAKSALSHAAGQDGEQCRAASVEDSAVNAVLTTIRRERDAWLSWNHDHPDQAAITTPDVLEMAANLIRALSRGVPEGNAVIPWRDEIDRMYVEGWAQSLRRIKDYRAYFIEHGYHPEYVAVRLERLLAAIAAQRKEGE